MSRLFLDSGVLLSGFAFYGKAVRKTVCTKGEFMQIKKQGIVPALNFYI